MLVVKCNSSHKSQKLRPCSAIERFAATRKNTLVEPAVLSEIDPGVPTPKIKNGVVHAFWWVGGRASSKKGDGLEGCIFII